MGHKGRILFAFYIAMDKAASRIMIGFDSSRFGLGYNMQDAGGRREEVITRPSELMHAI